MLPEKGDDANLWDMFQAAEAVVRFIQGRTFEDYLSDLFFRSAVERQIEIIGEAGRRVSDQFQSQHQEIPWQKIVAQRHVLAHEYDDIQHDLIWKVATVHIPVLISLLRPFVKPPAN